MLETLFVDLLQTYEALTAACRDFADTARADAKLPVLLPTYTGKPKDAREAAIASLTELWHPEPGAAPIKAGILCASAPTCAQAEALNAAKAAFQAAVLAVRAKGKPDKSRIERLVDRVLKQEGRRNNELAHALRRARINRLDLVRCYRTVRILPPRLVSLSWTWATSHASIVPVTLPEALAMANSLADETARAAALARLTRLDASEKLAQRKPLPNQLRANLVCRDGDTLVRKTVTISGVVLCQDDALPRTLWRDNPAVRDHAPPRLRRLDATIAPQAFVTALRLHRYTDVAHAR